MVSRDCDGAVAIHRAFGALAPDMAAQRAWTKPGRSRARVTPSGPRPRFASETSPSKRRSRAPWRSHRQSRSRMVLEMIGPMPRTLIRRSHPASRLRTSSISLDKPSMRSSNRCQSPVGSKPVGFDAEAIEGAFDHGAGRADSACRIARVASTSRMTAALRR